MQKKSAREELQEIAKALQLSVEFPPEVLAETEAWLKAPHIEDPALVDLVRKEQDLSKQINAQLGALNNALSSEVREDNVIKATSASLDKLRADRDNGAAADLNTPGELFRSTTTGPPCAHLPSKIWNTDGLCIPRGVRRKSKPDRGTKRSVAITGGC